MHKDNRTKNGEMISKFRDLLTFGAKAKKSLHIPTDASVQSSPSIPSTMQGKH